MGSNKVDYVSYDEIHMKIVEAGIDEIQKYIDTGKASEIRAILLCLDMY